MESVREITPRQLREHSAWLTPVGIGLVVLGLVALAATFVTTLATVVLFAALLLIAGAGHLLHAFDERGEHFAWQVFTGVLYVLAGALVFVDPVAGAATLTLVLGIFFAFVGVSRLSVASRMTGRLRTLTRVTGVIDLVLALLIVLGWPATGAWVIGLFVGLELLLAGITLLMLRQAVPDASTKT